MNREIPGFYYDTAKRKYFRIEDSRTAPSQATWSSRNVKRRAVEQKQDEERRERLKREARRVKRAKVLGVPLMGGLVAREVGEKRGLDDVLARAWAGSLREKGSVNPWSAPGDARMVSSLWVGESDQGRDLGVVYGVSQDWLASSYMPRDADDRINFDSFTERYPRLSSSPTSYQHPLRSIGAVRYHEPSDKILLAGAQVRAPGIGITCFTPRSRPPGGEQWLVLSGQNGHTFTNSSVGLINAFQPAPSCTRMTCIAGTDKGIVQLKDDRLSWLTPSPPSPKRLPATTTTTTQSHKSKSKRKKHEPYPQRPPDRLPWQSDILSVDFLAHNPRDVILAGTRTGHVCLLDLRVPPDAWSLQANTLRHTSSVAHVRSAGGAYSVLAAGPRSAMRLYDIRFLKERQQQQQVQLDNDTTGGHGSESGNVYRWNTNATTPILTFPSYRNDAHIHTGLDILTTPGYGSHTCGYSSGLVAATHDDNTVGIYSLQDGTRIPAGDVDKISAWTVIRCVQWQTLPGDRHPSLFVGEGPRVAKYSFWA